MYRSFVSRQISVAVAVSVAVAGAVHACAVPAVPAPDVRLITLFGMDLSG